jgi:hypothetical protein
MIENLPEQKDRTIEPGQRFGRLVVLSFVEYRSKNPYFRFRCDCGHEKVIASSAVKSGDTKSCGCYRRQHVLAVAPLLPGRDGHAALRLLFKNYKSRARQRELEFSLSLGEFESLIASSCEYCGCPPAKPSRKKYSDFLSNGIDRIDSTLGYITGNVVPACRTCNTAKSTMTTAQFESWILRVFKHRRLEENK